MVAAGISILLYYQKSNDMCEMLNFTFDVVFAISFISFLIPVLVGCGAILIFPVLLFVGGRLNSVSPAEQVRSTWWETKTIWRSIQRQQRVIAKLKRQVFETTKFKTQECSICMENYKEASSLVIQLNCSEQYIPISTIFIDCALSFAFDCKQTHISLKLHWALASIQWILSSLQNSSQLVSKLEKSFRKWYKSLDLMWILHWFFEWKVTLSFSMKKLEELI